MTISNLQSSELNYLEEISDEGLKAIIGGAAQCTYAGQTYSEGATLSNGQTCMSNGTWSQATR